MHSVLMVAAENATFPGGKVGGIGDVIRDVCPALARAGCSVQVVTPTFADVLARAAGSPQFNVSVQYRGGSEQLRLLDISGDEKAGGVRHWVLDHPLFSAGGGIYNDDPASTPFATDASKFSLFCAAVGQSIVEGHFGPIEVLHLHDWHAAWLLLLRRFDPQYRSLQSIKTVYTIHNLALQGVRPLSGHGSSLKAWFPDLQVDPQLVLDRRWSDCVNPTAVAIRLADAVHTVSPSYALEIVQPSAVAERGYYGGEGLEDDLRQAADQGRLHGILNGCDYPDKTVSSITDRRQLLEMCESVLLHWVARRASVAPAHLIALTRLRQCMTNGMPDVLLTSVGRITGQKVRLLQQPVGDRVTALDAMLQSLGGQGLFLCLGTGSNELEMFLSQSSAEHSNFVFLNGYSEKLADAFYALGDLFVMPSSFEPCGISQLLAMRSGQPCLVHGVGGLRDTVRDGVTGFVFNGDNPQQQARNLVARFNQAMDLRRDEPGAWQSLSKAAKATRFAWDDSVKQYCSRLYSPTH